MFWFRKKVTVLFKNGVKQVYRSKTCKVTRNTVTGECTGIVFDNPVSPDFLYINLNEIVQVTTG